MLMRVISYWFHHILFSIILVGEGSSSFEYKNILNFMHIELLDVVLISSYYIDYVLDGVESFNHWIFH